MLDKQLESMKQQLRCMLEKEVCQTDEQIYELIDTLILKQRKIPLPLAEKNRLRKELFYSVRKMDVLQELLEDSVVTEIMVNGPNAIFVEKNGRIEKSDRSFSSEQKLMDVVMQIAGRCNRVVNESKPIVDARLENGDRVNVVISPVALDGPVLTIRRFPKEAITMDDLISYQTLSKEAAQELKAMVQKKLTIVVGGGTSTGKTTFLNALSAYIPKSERVITIEDNAELQLQGLDNLVRLEAKEANMAGAVSVTIRDLIKTALRMRPDRIIVGEVRGAEAVEMLFSAVNTGHRGSLCSAHANSCYDMISRLETMVLMGMELPIEAIDRQIASGIDVFVHLGRMPDGQRKLIEITEVAGYQEGKVCLNPLYVWKNEELVKVGSPIGW